MTAVGTRVALELQVENMTWSRVWVSYRHYRMRWMDGWMMRGDAASRSVMAVSARAWI